MSRRFSPRSRWLPITRLRSQTPRASHRLVAAGTSVAVRLLRASVRVPGDAVRDG